MHFPVLLGLASVYIIYLIGRYECKGICAFRGQRRVSQGFYGDAFAGLRALPGSPSTVPVLSRTVFLQASGSLSLWDMQMR